MIIMKVGIKNANNYKVKKKIRLKVIKLQIAKKKKNKKSLKISRDLRKIHLKGRTQKRI